MLVWTSDQPMGFEVLEHLHKATVMVPWDVMQDQLPHGTTLRGGILDSREGIGALVFSHLASITGQLDKLTPDAAAAIGRSAVDLITACAVPQLDLPGRRRDAHLRRVEAYIAEHLDEGDLDPSRIATANALSLRYLHRLFHETGRTVSSWILDQRLERCRTALTDPMFSQTSVTDIAIRFGFNDSSHFSRTFRHRYQQSPAAYRAESTASIVT